MDATRINKKGQLDISPENPALDFSMKMIIVLILAVVFLMMVYFAVKRMMGE